MRRSIQSKFCVLGIGSGHNASLLNLLSGIGSEQGSYTYDDVGKFMAEAVKEMDVSNSVIINIDGKLHSIPPTYTAGDKVVFEKIITIPPERAERAIA